MDFELRLTLMCCGLMLGSMSCTSQMASEPTMMNVSLLPSSFISFSGADVGGTGVGAFVGRGVGGVGRLVGLGVLGRGTQ